MTTNPTNDPQSFRTTGGRPPEMTEAQELRVEAAFKRIAGRTGAEAETTANLTKELAAIQERHIPLAAFHSDPEARFCLPCRAPWPCDAARSARALQAVVEVLERDEAASSHNEGLSIAQVADLMPRPTPEEYRRAIEEAMEAGA